MNITIERLQEILLNHSRWIQGAEGGERAYLQGADLRGADLQGADLQGAYLQGADLQGAYFYDREGTKIVISKQPLSLSGLRWHVIVWDTHMQIGCELHNHAQWAKYDDARIAQMDSGALEFWREQKGFLLGLCARHAIIKPEDDSK